ncbi:D-arabinono-1,4-lactone oxidase [Monosporozyma servazzii]
MSISTLSTISKQNYKFQNWAGIYSSKPQLYFQPTSVDQVVEIVKNANEQGRKVTVVGSGHTPNTLCITNDWMVNLDKLNHVSTLTSEHSEYADVTVEAGISSFDLNKYLSDHGYVLQNLPSINTPTLAGMISTGTHGSSAYHGLVSSQIVNLTLVNGRGEVVFVDSETEPDLFKAMLLSLGQIGIIVELTVRVVPKFNLKVTQEIIDFNKLIDMWDYLWTSTEFIKVWWFPYNKKCVIWRGQKTADAVTPIKQAPFLSKRVYRFIYQSLLWVSTQVCGRLTPFVERWVFKNQFKGLGGLGDVEPEVLTSMDGFTLDCLYSQFVDEWGCPLVDGPEVLRKLEQIIDEGRKNHQFYVHAPMEIRCSNTTLPKTLNPNVAERSEVTKGAVYGNILRPYLDNTNKLATYVPVGDVTNSQLTMFINATVYRPFGCNSKVYEWFTRFEKVMIDAKGKPHWAKNFIGSTELAMGNMQTTGYKEYQCRGLGKFIKEKYQTDLPTFQSIKSKQDPNGIFDTNQDWLIRNAIVE